MGDVPITIQLAAKRSGLSAHVIRMWEKRYNAVRPARTETGRRMYSEGDVERLGLLRAATVAGHRIGNIAGLPSDQLKALAAEEDEASESPPPASTPESVVRSAMQAIQDLDSNRLEEVLELAAVSLGARGLLLNVISPLARRIGEYWSQGIITIAHEHFATNIIQGILKNRFRAFAESEAGPLLVVATPSNQLHELGACMVSAAASDAGWRILYLGASVPATEIAGAAIAKNAQAVALSIVYPDDDPSLVRELQMLRKLLPDKSAILVGGRACSAYSPTLAEVEAIQISDLEGLASRLNEMRGSPYS